MYINEEAIGYVDSLDNGTYIVYKTSNDYPEWHLSETDLKIRFDIRVKFR